MDGYFIHLNGSTLKVGLYNGNQSPRFLSEDLLPTVLSHSKIIDPGEFVKEFSKVLAQDIGETLPKLPLYFVIEPELTELFLLTTNKDGGSGEEYIMQQIKERLVDENPDDLYFSYFKIAPFVYQFIGIKKDTLQAFLDVSNILGLEIRGVFPLGLILSKTNSDVSSMFVFPRESGNVVVFSELTGVSFAEKLEGKIALKELEELFWKLSVYNNKHGDLNVYTFQKYEHKFDSQKVLWLDGEGAEENYEEIALAKKTLDNSLTLMDSPTNLLNVLPVPEPERSKAVPAMAFIASLILVAGLILQLTVGFNNILGKNPSVGKGQDVLSKQDQSNQEVTPSATPVTAQTPQKEIKRTDLKIRVENGNGIAGSAGKLKSYLEGFGYNVVSIGNSGKSDYPKTQINLPKDLSDYETLLTNDLKTNYSVEVTKTDAKPTDYDVLIIAGLN